MAAVAALVLLAAGVAASLVANAASPWWATWWFRVLAALAIAGLLVAVHRARTRAINTRSQRLEREVTDRRRAQEALARSEQQLRLIADSLPVLIAYVDAQLRCVFANVAADRLLNRSPGELEGRPLDEILPPEILVKIAAPMAHALAGQGDTFELDVGDGVGRAPRRISVTLVPHTTPEEGTQGFYTLAQDITDRVRSEEAVRRQQEQLAHASRVLTLGELAAALAHELNQPLTAILSNAQATLMLQGPHQGGNGDVQEALRDIAHDAARAGDIIRKLRDLARRGESHREPMDLNQAIIGVKPLLRAGALEDEVTLEMELSPGLPPAQGDVIQVQQVILNLARNGMEAMRTVARESRRLRILSRTEGCSAVVEVTDTGTAVSDETFQSLFVPFYTTKTGGLGMGLAITRSIVEAHGGRIVAERNRGEGLTLRFTIPLLRSQMARSAR